MRLENQQRFVYYVMENKERMKCWYAHQHWREQRLELRLKQIAAADAKPLEVTRGDLRTVEAVEARKGRRLGRKEYEIGQEQEGYVHPQE
jgi:hypothetical protein